MRLIFGAITCAKARMANVVERHIVIQKSPSTRRLQNVFVHELYQDHTNRLSDEEDRDKGLLCESQNILPVPEATNKDIALIRLDRAFTETELKFETTNINTICLEHSEKVTFSTKQPLTAFAAGFGFKDDHSDQDKLKNALQPYLSFLRVTVFQYGIPSWIRPDFRKFHIAYGSEDTEQQFTLTLDDDQQRDTAGVSVTFSNMFIL